MRNALKYVPCVAIAILSSLSVFSQSDCNSAIPLCNDFYSETSASLNTGSVYEYTGDCNTGEFASMWYVFTAQTTGTLGFVIDPNVDADDYDWGLFDITNTGCAGIGVNAPVVSCNSYGSFGSNGPTGISTANGGSGNSNGPGDLNGPAFNADLNVVVGQTFALCVMNWSQSFDGYSIDFGGSTAALYDNISPNLDIVSTVCNQGGIQVIFDEPIQVSSVSPNDFMITGPNGNVTILSALPEDPNAESDQTILLQTAVMNLPPGDYQLTLTSTAGYLTDACANIATGSFNFTIAASTLSVSAGDDVQLCPGESVILNATGDFTSVQWLNGPASAQYEVSAAGNYQVTASANGCELSDNVQVTMIAVQPWNLGDDTTECSNQPLVYNTTLPVVWENGQVGTSSNPDGEGFWSATIELQSCFIEDSVYITVVEAPIVDIGNDTLLCDGETLNIATAVPCTWNGGPQTTSVQINQAGQYVAAYSDGVCIVSDQINVQFSSGPSLPWSGTYTYCQGEEALFDAQESGADSLVWWNNDTTWTQTIDSTGEYWISLFNECGSFTVNFSIVMNDCSDYAYFPNSFTPNQDGINDAWLPVVNNIQSYHIEIFDRWGNVVFESKDPNEAWVGGWKGGDYFVGNGIYPYRATIDFLSGNIEILQGQITILR
jgi:gliding motility-associated-like protein